jgi:hypothetical protein
MHFCATILSSLKNCGNGLTQATRNHYRNNPELPETRPHRDFEYPWVKPLFFAIAFAYFVVIAIISTATADYQFVPIVTTAWVDPNKFWFNKFVPSSYQTQTRICGGHAFHIGDGVAHSKSTAYVP